MGSVRLKNFMFGIQDFNIFKEIQKSGVQKNELMNEMERLLGKKEEMKYIPDRNIKLSYCKEYSTYIELRNSLVKKFLIK